MDGCEPPCGCWEMNSGPLEEQPMLLTSEPPLQPFFIYLFGLMKLILHAQMLVFVCVFLQETQKSILVHSCSPHWLLRSGISLASKLQGSLCTATTTGCKFRSHACTASALPLSHLPNPMNFLKCTTLGAERWLRG